MLWRACGVSYVKEANISDNIQSIFNLCFNYPFGTGNLHQMGLKQTKADVVGLWKAHLMHRKPTNTQEKTEDINGQKKRQKNVFNGSDWYLFEPIKQ